MPELKSIYRNHSSVDAPLYSDRDVLRYLRLPQVHLSAPWPIAYQNFRSPDSIMPAPRIFFTSPETPQLASPESISLHGERFSFRQLVEFFVHSSGPVLWWVWNHPGEAIGHESNWRSTLYSIHKLSHEARSDPAIRDEYENRRRLYESRIEHEDGTPVRLYPFTRAKRNENSPRLIAIDPRIAFGNPVVGRQNIRVDVIAGRFRAGESVNELARDCKLQKVEIEEAVRYDSGYVD